MAATDTWTDPDGIRAPAGEVQEWLPATNQTVCGLPLAQVQLRRFAHLDWREARPATGRDADRVTHVPALRRARAGRTAR